MMNLADIFKASDAITVKRVFGEPYEKDGLTIIPAAMIGGGGGGGGGHDAQNQEGEGGGFGLGVLNDGVGSWRGRRRRGGKGIRAGAFWSRLGNGG